MVTLKWFGTASVALKCEEGSILFDPFVPLSGGEAPTVLSDYDGFSDIFVTHGHIDHIASLPDIYKKNPDIRIYCTKTPYQSLIKMGLRPDNLVKITYGETLNVNGFTLTVHHGRHAVLPKASCKQLKRIFGSPYVRNLPYILKKVVACPEKDETVLYEIHTEGKSVALMGSMNLREDVIYPVGSDCLILPYNGWEDNYPPAVRVIESLKPQKVFLDHYDDTFPPISGPVDRKPILEKYPSVMEELRYGRDYCL